jgi:hypothetical protein
VGISVTRAMRWMTNYTFAHALALLKKKLNGLVQARACISDVHSFHTCVLHILCQNFDIAQLIKSAYIYLMHTHAGHILLEDMETGVNTVIVIASVCAEPTIYNETKIVSCSQ